MNNDKVPSMDNPFTLTAAVPANKSKSRKGARRAQLLHDAEMMTYLRRLGLLESAFSYKTGQRT